MYYKEFMDRIDSLIRESYFERNRKITKQELYERMPATYSTNVTLTQEFIRVFFR